jgi:hypothetical protein
MDRRSSIISSLGLGDMCEVQTYRAGGHPPAFCSPRVGWRFSTGVRRRAMVSPHLSRREAHG